MPVKQRAAKGRRPHFSDAVLDLFEELEAVPPPRRASRDWEDGSRLLAGLLKLTDEYWQRQNVLDRSRSPCHPPEYCAHHSWHRCRAVRERLLEAVEDRARHRKEESGDGL